jgi:hypothetical protein
LLFSSLLLIDYQRRRNSDFSSSNYFRVVVSQGLKS